MATTTKPPAPPPQASCALTRDLTLPSFGLERPPTTTPRLVYGTAWKKDRTAELVYQALRCGFRGIDTAAQPRHYQERLVGDGMRRAVAEGIVDRDALYLQTKFTSVDGQDLHNLPYDPAAPLEEQVKASVASSLENLAAIPSSSSSSSSSSSPSGAPPAPPSYLDCLVLHSPLQAPEDTLTVWRALEAYVPHRIRHLGIANAPPEIVEYLLSPAARARGEVRVPPSVVQNRFYRETGYEAGLRRLCREAGVVFQTFWTLTGNPQLLSGKSKSGAVVSDLVARTGTSREAALYALVLGLEGTSILDGTTSEEHMRADLEDIMQIERWAGGEGKGAWDDALRRFKGLIGDA